MSESAPSAHATGPAGDTRPVLLLQMGNPPEDIVAHFGDQAQWFRQALGEPAPAMRVVKPYAGDALPDPAEFRATVISGSWSMVTDRADWSERTGDWVREAVQAGHPVLGVCYGHQLMAHALGGRVDYHPDGPEVGVRTVTLAPEAAADPLLAHFPPQFAANLSHEQSVLTLPPGAVALASSAHDAHQIVRYAPNAVSVQFHPEFSPELMRACMTRREARVAALEEEAQAEVADTHQPTPAQEAVQDGGLTPVARDVLLRFTAAPGG